MRWRHDSALLPIDCFAYHFEVKKGSLGEKLKKNKSTKLPTLSDLQSEKSFAQLWWLITDEGLQLYIEVSKPCEKVNFPYVERGDGIELFIDTRDNKASKVITQYCHHFVLLGEPVEGKQLFDVTRPHVYHTRDKVDTELAQIQTKLGRKEYSIELFLPKQMLFGYDVSGFDRLGFTYKINGFNRTAQDFNLASSEYNIAHHPHLWGSFLIK